MKISHLILCCLLFVWPLTNVRAGTLSGVGGGQIPELVAKVAIGGFVVAYGVAQYGFAAGASVVHWVQERGKQKRLRKEAQVKSVYEQTQLKAQQEAATQAACKKQKEVEGQERLLETQRQQAAHRQIIQPILDNQKNGLQSYYELQQECIIEEFQSLYVPSHKYLLVRHEALHKHLNGNDTWQDDVYEITYSGQLFLKDQSIALGHYTHFYGNDIQRALHQEYVDIMNATADFCYSTRQHALERQRMATTLSQFGHVGQQYNHAGHVLQSLEIADFCHGLLALSKDALTIMCDVGMAIGKGAVHGGYNFGYKLVRLDTALKGLAHTIKNTVIALANITDYVETSIIEHQRTMWSKRRQDAHDIASGKFTPEYIFERDMLEADRKWDETVAQAHQKLKRVWQAIDYQSSLMAVEKSSEMATESVLSYLLCQTVSSFVGKGTNALADVIEAGGSGDYYALPFNGTSVNAVLSYEMVIAQEAAHAVRATGVLLAEAIDKVGKVVPIVVAGGGPVNDWKLNRQQDVLKLSPKLTSDELSYLRNNYDRTCIHDDQFVEFDYEHVFEGEISRDGSLLKGLHHDYSGFLRKQGFIRNIKLHQEGFYSAEVLFNGNWIPRSFFPEDWTKDDVMKCVVEALKNHDMQRLQGSRTLFKKIRKSGIEISIVIENKTGRNITFFPNCEYL